MTPSKKIITVGDLVEFRFGARTLLGKVVEDRGEIGYKGRNLYRILVDREGEETMNLELPADELSVAQRIHVVQKSSPA